MEWTPYQIEQLRADWDAGYSTAEIGRRVGASKNAIVGKAHRLDLDARPSPIRGRSTEPATKESTKQKPLCSVSDEGDFSSMPPRTATPFADRPPPAPPPPPVMVEWRITPAPRKHVCQWPIGHPKDQSFRFCCDRALVGKPYCEVHYRTAYVVVHERR